MTKSNKLNIYLIKSEFTSYNTIVKPSSKKIPIKGVGEFFLEESKPRQPDWIKNFFRQTLNGSFEILTSSAKGVLLVPVEDGRDKRIFALVFGIGRHLLIDGVIEERFGLKVVLNSVKPDSLRSIDKTTLGSEPKQSREQISREGPASQFGIDIEQDLVNAVTGRSNDPELGKTISGRDSLSLSAKYDITNVRKLLLLCLRYYKSKNYKKDFDWIDQIRDVRNPALLEVLNEELIKRLNARQLEKIWMAPPEVIDWVDVKGFRYSKKKRGTLHDDIELPLFLEDFSGQEITLDKLKSRLIFLISAKKDDISHSWNSYKCLYAELEHKGVFYILNAGKWYEIAKSFSDAVINDFESTETSNLTFPDYNHTDENSYNKDLAKTLQGSHCMDCQQVHYGGGHSSVEFCDVLTADKKIIHVKRYSGSAQLSHLFAQGYVSGELFVQDEDFRKELNNKLPATHKLPDTSVRPKPEEYEVSFAIISKSQGPLEIPFFSKVSFRSAKRRLGGYGYKVTKAKILKIN